MYLGLWPMKLECLPPSVSRRGGFACGNTGLLNEFPWYKYTVQGSTCSLYFKWTIFYYSNEDLGNCPHLTKQPAVQMLKCNWSTIVFENHGGSFSSILRRLPWAGDFGVQPWADNSHYWRWSKGWLDLFYPITAQLCVHSPQFPDPGNFSPKSGWREGLCWFFFFLLHFPFFIWFLTAMWK